MLSQGGGLGGGEGKTRGERSAAWEKKGGRQGFVLSVCVLREVSVCVCQVSSGCGVCGLHCNMTQHFKDQALRVERGRQGQSIRHKYGNQRQRQMQSRLQPPGQY